ncbi:hypothetical protein [Arsenicibacter rosenii]|uniref:Uncharacterized protein n=1 Tax=Arsenicibacter rosenii TaxID=1750698 RepID=A0A1S2VBR2_9BACT|nr:hypothetical protein [Arsenicibacter rosenii]OIN55860.1 hypothetical protein BLX24_27790 [Arsenicibacter rosenii]
MTIGHLVWISYVYTVVYGVFVYGLLKPALKKEPFNETVSRRLKLIKEMYWYVDEWVVDLMFVVSTILYFTMPFGAFRYSVTELVSNLAELVLNAQKKDKNSTE